MDPFFVGLLLVAAMVIAGVWLTLLVVGLVFRIIGRALGLVGRVAVAVTSSPAPAIRQSFAAPTFSATRCGNEKCLTALPPIARYCPRCGAAVGVDHRSVEHRAVAGRCGVARARVA